MRGRTWWCAALAAGLAVAAPAMAMDDEESVDAVEAEEDQGSPAADAVFDFLVAEFAAQRGDISSALATHNRMARELHDPAIARRAVELAIRTRSFPAALQSAALLLELEPDSTLAREIIAALVGSDNDIGKAQSAISMLLEKSGDKAPMLLQMGHLFAKYTDKRAVLEATRAIVKPYEDMAEAHYALGVAAFLADDEKAALEESRAALRSRPGWDQGAILRAQVLRKTAPGDVIPFYEEFVARHPESAEVRMQLGRELATAKRLGEAREAFREAEKAAPKDGQAPYAIGLLSLQLEDYLEAQGAFSRALKLGYKEPAAVYLGLGQASEGLKRYEEAIGWYQQVDSNDWVRAQLKIATLIARQQGLQAGREYLHKVATHSKADEVQVIQVEAQLLREAKAWQETYALLTDAAKKHPDSFELRYDRAMAAERVEKIDVLEEELREVIRMKPDYAHAYNALGYTLAEKTDRLEEARGLIEKAYKMAPEDPFVMDSLGWVHYRQGNLAESLRYLHKAYSARTDPEIAAHLGEVLWRSGQREEAQKVWRAALTENPDHETLLAVMQKFR
jgi:tetratricopeptide (TPR) repeat protein